jgi:hypothetical protein
MKSLSQSFFSTSADLMEVVDREEPILKPNLKTIQAGPEWNEALEQHPTIDTSVEK